MFQAAGPRYSPNRQDGNVCFPLPNRAPGEKQRSRDHAQGWKLHARDEMTVNVRDRTQATVKMPAYRERMT